MIEEPPKLTVVENRRRPTAAQISAFQGVSTGFVVDAMEGRGSVSSEIAPVWRGAGAVAGPALTADNGPADILATLAALAFLQDGDVLVVGTGGHRGCSASGDQVSGMAKNAGAAAIVVDGPMRDGPGIAAVGLPAWSVGLNPGSPFTTGPGTVGGSTRVCGMPVDTGDMIVADGDGVVVVPFAEIDRTIAALAAVAAAEAALEAEVAAGRKLPDAIQALLEGPETRYI